MGQGTTIQLVADSIELSALYLPPPPGVVVVTPEGADLLFRCSAVYGSRAAAQSSPTVTFTDGPALLTPGDPPVVGLIPPFSKGLAVLLDDVTDLRSGAQLLQVDAAPNITFLGGQSIQIGAGEYPARYGVPFMLAPDARFVRVGVTGGRAVTARLVYDLCL